MNADAPKFTIDRRDRLGAAVLGAPSQEMVVVRAADLKACLGLVDQIAEAQRLIGENARLERERDQALGRTVELEALRDQIAAANGRIQLLKDRLKLAAAVLKGEG